VKYRTQELTSSTLAWREGLAEWKPLFEIDEIKQVLQESNDEVNDQKVRSTMPPKNSEENDVVGEGESDGGTLPEADVADTGASVFYFSANE